MIVSKRESVVGRILLTLIMLWTVVPFISLFVTALHPSGTYPAGLEWPEEPQWSNFAKAFESANVGALVWSSVLIVVGVVPISLAIATMAGYALGHLRVPGHRWLLLTFILGLTLPFEGIITPLYHQIRDLGLLNTRWAIILPLIGLFMPFSAFWMHAHFVNVPKEISEAAEVDGANLWQAFWRVQVPLARPALSSLAILLFLWTWNQFLLTVVLVNDPTRRTAAGALGAFQGQWGTDIPLLCAGALIIMLPTLCVFLLFQRQFITAMMQGAVKG
ncbi:carbohydrate ABC transporter permease [Actinomyces ruminis]|uniref:Carbohydrate ABC transporter permease n=2 Tax=Actinomyces ruminis TaxID=1937003 RepID=A0ABX4MA64_9ACTO|nr:carbohydrate ABC transporter permease [Actinomyces ruminis]